MLNQVSTRGFSSLCLNKVWMSHSVSKCVWTLPSAILVFALQVRTKLLGPCEATYSGYTCYTGIADFIPPDIETVGYVFSDSCLMLNRQIKFTETQVYSHIHPNTETVF